MTQYKMLSIL